MQVTFPNDYNPRWYQEPSWNALWNTSCPKMGDEEGDVRRAFLLHHRRAGKDLNMFNLMQCKMAQKPGVYGHIFPTLTEGRKVIWEGQTRDGRTFLDYVPGHKEWDNKYKRGWVRRKRDDQMSIKVANGSVYQVLGADHPDSVRGMGLRGVILSEYAFFKGPEIWDIIRPMLAENGGWMVAITTPNGRNHSHALHRRFEDLSKGGDPIYYAETLRASYTGAVDPKRIQEDLDSGMSQEKADAEYECSYDASVEGAFYGKQMKDMLEDGRICRVPHNPNYPVFSCWDLGVSDMTAIWFYQKIGGQCRFIDFEWLTGVGIPEFATMMSGGKLGEQDYKAKKRYVYDTNYAPHDIAVRDISSQGAESRLNTARKLGLKFKVVPKGDIEDGRSAVRAMLATCVMDEKFCQLGADALRQYVKKPMEGIVGPKGETLFTNDHVHNWASHPADALRTGAMGSALGTFADGGDEPPCQEVPIV